MDVSMAAGQRSIVVEGPDEKLGPGRYIVRVEARPEASSVTVRASTDAVVAAPGVTMSLSTVAYRRGPTTGLAYMPTADPRFRRTERLRVEVALFTDRSVTVTGRVLTREGQPLPLQVVTSERKDEQSAARYVVADVTLAPLAQGDFVLELAAGKESATYGFRIVP
jgi:hypothetical protein